MRDDLWGGVGSGAPEPFPTPSGPSPMITPADPAAPGPLQHVKRRFGQVITGDPRAPSGPGYPPAGRVVATAGVLVGGIAQTPHTAPHAAPVDPGPAAPGRPAGSAPAGVIPLAAGAGGRQLGRGSTGSADPA